MSPSHRFRDPATNRRAQRNRRRERRQHNINMQHQEATPMTAKPKKPTFELVEEPQQATKPKFVASYPGETEVPMSDEAIARAEVERAALLAGIHIEDMVSRPKPVASQPVDEVIAVAQHVAPVAASELEAA